MTRAGIQVSSLKALLQTEEEKAFAESDQRLVQTVAGFLGKQMES